MTIESDDYERFISELIANVQASHRRISDLGSGGTNTIRGRSGQDHQVDVSFIDHDCPRTTLVLIECKRYNNNRPVDLEHVKVVFATLTDIRLASNHQALDVAAIIVSTNGEREGARRFAKHYGIVLEVTEHRENYSFRYENIVQGGLSEAPQFADKSDPTVLRLCPICKKRFEAENGQATCSNCG